MRHIVSLLLLAATMFLSGCLHKIIPETVGQEIISGKTTKKEVLKLYGRPYLRYKTPGMSIVSGDKKVVLHKGGEVWFYYVHYLGALDLMEQETLRILFNDQGIVSSYTITNAPPDDPL
ncbi:hypothetical protein [Geobacter sp. AOG2]|uniref:hypothetical protein n=1 Tax=Geobacter sp. AOG2 TaxID=1566347 RepID=UPI001CC3A5AA|nr:hypothetical protein [Geobacter sp. AOG2]GFE61495.1 hypothetical protein AOG2_20820 [Geobacter sp. AOG2]